MVSEEQLQPQSFHSDLAHLLSSIVETGGKGGGQRHCAMELLLRGGAENA